MCQIHVRAKILFNLVMALFTVLNFQLILNKFSPPGNPHPQHCEPGPVAKEHTSWYNYVNKSSIHLQLILPEEWSVSSQLSKLLIKLQLHLEHCLGTRGEKARLQNPPNCVNKEKTECARAFLRPFWFWMGISKVTRWNGLEILVPKHLWKSKIGPLQQILDTKRYVSFFLGHPVYWNFYIDINEVGRGIEVHNFCALLCIYTFVFCADIFYFFTNTISQIKGIWLHRFFVP